MRLKELQSGFINEYVILNKTKEIYKYSLLTSSFKPIYKKTI